MRYETLVMKISLTNLFAGLIFVVILWKKTKALAYPCKIYTDHRNLLRADCEDIPGLTKVPQDLDMQLTALDISRNKIDNFDGNAFKRYPKLISLRMESLTPIQGRNFIPHNEKMFVPLTSLEDLDISNSTFTDHPIFEWPLKLQRLSLSRDKISTLDLSTLTHLKQLDATNNMLKDFPTLHPSAPINWIDLSGNPLDNVSAEHLAPFCQLQFLGLQVARGGLLTNPLRLCQCLRLERWMLEKNIEGAHSLFCFNDTYRFACNITIVPELYGQYEVCLAKLPASPLWDMFIYLIAFSLIFPVLYIINAAIQNFLARRRTAEEFTSYPPSPELDQSSAADSIEVESSQSEYEVS